MLSPLCFLVQQNEDQGTTRTALESGVSDGRSIADASSEPQVQRRL